MQTNDSDGKKTEPVPEEQRTEGKVRREKKKDTTESDLKKARLARNLRDNSSISAASSRRGRAVPVQPMRSAAFLPQKRTNPKISTGQGRRSPAPSRLRAAQPLASNCINALGRVDPGQRLNRYGDLSRPNGRAAFKALLISRRLH